MISKRDALSLVAEVQAELAAELGEPAYEAKFSGESPSWEMALAQDAERPFAQRDQRVIEASVVAAEHRASEAEKRAEVAEKALRASKRNSRSMIGKRGSARSIGRVVVVNVDGEKVAVQPGHTVEVKDGSIGQISPTSKHPFRAYTLAPLVHRDKKQ